MASLLHMLWDYPKIQIFWREVYELLNVKLEMSIPLSPELALLGIQDDDQ